MRATPNQPEEQLPWIEALLPRKVTQVSDAPKRCGSVSTSGVSPSTTTEAAGYSSGTSGAHCRPRSTRIHATGPGSATPTTGSTGACPRTLRELWRRCPWAQGERPSKRRRGAARGSRGARESKRERLLPSGTRATRGDRRTVGNLPSCGRRLLCERKR